MNYLVLRGLKLHYYTNWYAKYIYNELRNNLISNVCSELERTGYFFENYNKVHENG